MNRITRQRLAVTILGILLVILCNPHGAAAAPQKTFLWRARSPKATVYLLGSIHFMKEDSYPLAKGIEDAFDKSGTLVVEANVGDLGQMDMTKFLESSFYTGEDTIENHISRETYELLRKEAAGIGLPTELINRQKPWMLALTLTSLELMKAGYDPTFGIDMHFLSKAEGKKKIAELESLDFQVDLFSHFSDKEQEAFLLYTLKELSSLGAEADSIVSAWRGGDTGAMGAVMAKGLDEGRLASVYEKMLYRRNTGMASKIEGYLRSGGTYFVVVGAAHLIGTRGIIEILKARGYPVEQM